MATPDRKRGFAPLSGRVTRHGVTVQVHIYRFAGTDDGWTLGVVDHEDGSTVWDEVFATDADAYEAFDLCVRKEGIRTFTDDTSLLIDASRYVDF